jgi:hypothetical protein
MRPLQLLQGKLNELIRAREKSIQSFKDGKINASLHETHMNNLTPLIKEYKYIIMVINQYA